MLQTTSSRKKIDSFWSIYAVVCLLFSIFLWRIGYDFFIPLWMVLLGLLFAFRQLLANRLFDIFKVFLSLGMLFYLLKLMTEHWSIWQ